MRTTTTLEASPRLSADLHAQSRALQDQMVCTRYVLLTIAGFGLLFLIFGILLYLKAIYATIMHFNEPCDQPLSWYNVIASSQAFLLKLFFRINKAFEGRGWAAFASTSLNQVWQYLFVAFVLLCWGIYLIHNCDTCHQTNPGLYTASIWWIWYTVAFFVFLISCIVLTFCFWRQVRFFFRACSTEGVKKGCKEAVHKLEHVATTSAELLDPEEGVVMHCSICTDAFSGPKVVVRTKCSHLFHEDCLAQWCENHRDCPFCRRRVDHSDHSDRAI